MAFIALASNAGTVASSTGNVEIKTDTAGVAFGATGDVCVGGTAGAVKGGPGQTTAKINGSTALPVGCSVRAREFVFPGFVTTTFSGGGLLKVPKSTPTALNSVDAEMQVKSGGTTTVGKASWTYSEAPGFFGVSRTADHRSSAGVTRATGGSPAGTAYGYSKDPIFFISSEDAIIDLLIEIDYALFAQADPGEHSWAYVEATALFGHGEIVGEEILSSAAFFQSVVDNGELSGTDDEILRLSFTLLKDEVYWLTADVTSGAFGMGIPEPPTPVLVFCGCIIAALAAKDSRSRHIGRRLRLPLQGRDSTHA